MGDRKRPGIEAGHRSIETRRPIMSEEWGRRQLAGGGGGRAKGTRTGNESVGPGRGDDSTPPAPATGGTEPKRKASPASITSNRKKLANGNEPHRVALISFLLRNEQPTPTVYSELSFSRLVEHLKSNAEVPAPLRATNRTTHEDAHEINWSSRHHISPWYPLLLALDYPFQCRGSIGSTNLPPPPP